MGLATIDHLLTTTRSVRKRLDLSRPVELEVVEKCIELALQAPTGSNLQGWHFMVVTDAEKRKAVSEIYRKAWNAYRGFQQAHPLQWKEDDLRKSQAPRVGDSSRYLFDHLHEVPVQVIPCIDSKLEFAPHLGELAGYPSASSAQLYGSILPAAWSLMLALRSRGLGSAWTTLHLMYEEEAAAVLGIPGNITQCALLPVAYYTGTDFKPAKRLPQREATHWNSWGTRR